MADALDVYARFSATPLRLRTKPTSPSSAARPAKSNASPASLQRLELTTPSRADGSTGFATPVRTNIIGYTTPPRLTNTNTKYTTPVRTNVGFATPVRNTKTGAYTTPVRGTMGTASVTTPSRVSFTTPSRANYTTPLHTKSSFTTPASVRKQIPTKADVDRLEARVEVECRVHDESMPEEPVQEKTPKPTNPVLPRRRSARTRSKAAVASVVPASTVVSAPIATVPAPAPLAKAKKQKRVTRSVAVLNTNTGGVYMDTPTKGAVPPKRSRKSTRQPSETNDLQKQLELVDTKDGEDPAADDEKENVSFDMISITRNMMDVFADIDNALPDPTELGKPKKSKKTAPTRRQQAPSETKKKRAPPTKTKPAISEQEPVRRSRRLHEQVDIVVTQSEVLEVVTTSDSVETPKELDKPDTLQVIETVEVARSVEIVKGRRKVKGQSKPDTIVDTDAVAVSPAIDVVQEFCTPLLEMKTTAGALFALWFNALGFEVEVSSGAEADTLVEILREFFAVCHRISDCEAMARARAAHDEESNSRSRNGKNARRTVRFRHFDLSSLDLNYVNDRSITVFVQKLIRNYEGIVDNLAKIWRRRLNPVHINMIAHVIGVLNDTDRLAERTMDDGPVSKAFRSMSEFEHDQVRASQPFFSSEFAKVLTKGTVQPTFLEVVFSDLMSSLARFRLRELFLPFDPAELLDEGEKLNIAKYEHQDFGAAVHRALQEVYLFEEMTCPVLAVINKAPNPPDKAVKKAVQKLDVDDLVLVERYILASRYLRLSFAKCILADCDEDEETALLLDRMEKLCALMKRMRFEDETHFFPLASVKEFVRVLERLEPSFAVLEKVLESVGYSNHDVEAPCAECNQIVTRDQQAEAITCCRCGRCFHLSCLHLPPSFAQFAADYTCPSCFVGRRR